MAGIINIKELFTPNISNNLVSKTKGDRVIWGIVIILTLISLLVVYSSTGSLAYKYSKSTESYLFKQFAFIILGILLIYFAHRVNYTIYARVAKILFLISIPLMIYTLMFGSRLNSANRWITLPVINMTMQTSDLAKLALIMYTARTLSKKQQIIKDFDKAFIPLILPIIVVCLLIVPANLSTAAVLFATCLILMFIGRVSLKHISLTVACGIAAFLVFIGIATLTSFKTRLDTWISRVEKFTERDKEVDYQTSNAFVAIANGGLIRLAPGKSIQRNFLPQPYSDYIYAIIIEEYGLLGGIIVLSLYLWFLYRCILIFIKSPGAFGALLAVGLSLSLVIQAIMNMSVTVGLLPVTGLPLPLVSMGGTSLLFTSFAIGIILSISRQIETQKEL